ncbi:MAG: hypothetical protein NT067_04750 [Candidatus Diapherotrites archaeon]|nr:hypothetical protein [Candidatus Diapherotrites archaeon]
MDGGEGNKGKNYALAYFKPIIILMALVMLPLVIFILALRFFLVILFTIHSKRVHEAVQGRAQGRDQKRNAGRGAEPLKTGKCQ